MKGNIKNKLTRIDNWYKWYVPKAAHRQHKSDKRFATKLFRRIMKDGGEQK